MRRLPDRIVALAAGALAAATLAAPLSARAFEVPGDSVAVHGRAQMGLEMDEGSTGFPWNDVSRSPLANSRVMLDLAAGTARWGRVYLKGAGTWRNFDSADSNVLFQFEQGDYVWSHGAPLTLRLFANERRYFTGELSAPLLDDDRIARYDHHGGLRAHGRAGAHVSWTGEGALLDDGSPDPRRVARLAVGARSRTVQATVSYLSDVQSPDSALDHAILKGEVTAFYRRATVIVAYEQSGFEDHALFVPSGRFDWSHYVGGNFTASMPASGAAFGEARLADIPFRGWGQFDLVTRYRATGPDYVDDLGSSAPGVVDQTSGVFFRHRERALDARVVYHEIVRSRLQSLRVERLEADVRAVLASGYDAFLRGAVGHRQSNGVPRENDNFIHAALARRESRWEAGVHAMVRDIQDGTFTTRYAFDGRVNWTATTAIYGRVVSSGSDGGGDAAYLRLEFRPVDHVFATLGYGRAAIGDGPYLLEDPDIGPTGAAESVYTITVRGDF